MYRRPDVTIPLPIPQTPSSASTTLLFPKPYSQQNPPFPSLQSTKPRPSSHKYKIPKRRFPPIFGYALHCSGLLWSGAICVKKAQNFSPPLVRRMILAMYVGRDRDKPSQIHVSSGEFQYLSSLEMSKEYHLRSYFSSSKKNCRLPNTLGVPPSAHR